MAEHRCELLNDLDPYENWCVDDTGHLDIDTEHYDENEQQIVGHISIHIVYCPFCGSKLSEISEKRKSKLRSMDLKR